MMRLLLAFLALLACAAPVRAARTVRPGVLRVATWNLGNLFDAEDDPDNPGDDEWTPQSWRRWTDQRYLAKSSNLVEVVALMKPDILCVQEVENKECLRTLAEMLATRPEAHPMPYYQLVNGEDRRGICVGLLSRHPIAGTTLHEFVPGLRGALHAELLVEGRPFHVIVCHWKSWLGNAALNTRIRMCEATGVRRVAAGILAKDPNASLVIAGDLNDNIDGESVLVGLRGSADRHEVGRDATMFYNAIGEIPESERGSFYYARRKVWDTFDQIFVTSAMLRPAGDRGPAWRLVPSATPVAFVFKLPQMMNANGSPRPFQRVRSKEGDRYEEGYSDHFPVCLDLVRGR